MLKAGSDAFLTVEQPPQVAVCDRRYVFNPGIGGDLDSSCPLPGWHQFAGCRRDHTTSPHGDPIIAAPMNTGTVAYHANDGQPNQYKPARALLIGRRLPVLSENHIRA